MIITIEKPSDYRHFLLGIVFFALFEIVWWSISPVFFALECVLPPVFVVIGEKLLKLAAFYYLFCKATVWDIQWKHLLAVLLLYAVIQLLAYLVSLVLSLFGGFAFLLGGRPNVPDRENP